MFCCTLRLFFFLPLSSKQQMSANYTVAVWMSSMVSPVLRWACSLWATRKSQAVSARCGGCTTRLKHTPSEIDSPRESSSILITNDTSSILTQDGHLGNNKLLPDYHFVLLVMSVIIQGPPFNVNKTTSFPVMASRGRQIMIQTRTLLEPEASVNYEH